ncbi:non-ribosomal peptide synthetase [Azorhizobium doebereinerae]|uniref:non-ribosomal peptide synthetase n=1 Tax=Azorhizobium doebereinerae TaxID=281091 RepID=UPI000417F712|nr:non-ribosomal peptide synthetase [Azorhizobium doebereinerae]
MTALLSAPPPSETYYQFDMSFAQERLWFLDQLHPGNPIYNVHQHMSWSAPLDIPALERTLNEIVRRHETLRTTFRTVGGRPCQIIAASRHVALPLVDLSELEASSRRREADRLARIEAHAPFDLAHGPLFRARLLRLGPHEYVLLLNMHHIVCDGWSVGNLVHEVEAIYAAFARGKPSPLPELPIQYADFAEWQRDWMSSNRIEALLDFWRERLAGCPPVLALPTDHPRPPMQSLRGDLYQFAVPAATAERLRTLGQQRGATLFMTLLAAFKVLLLRYCGQDDIVVGTPIANRTRVEVEPLIGFFVNTLVLRTSLADDPSFAEVVDRVRDTTLAAYAHQDLPFERLVEEIQPERSLGHHPLFQVMMVLQNHTRADAPGPGGGEVETGTGTAKFDLSLFLVEEGEGLRAVFEYSTDLFAAASIARMADNFRALLAALVAQPDTPVSRVSFLSAEERRLVVEAFNDTRADLEPGLCAHHLVERAARRAPDAPAVESDAGALTYGQLDAAANRLAHHLRAIGIGDRARIGLCLERTPDMVVAVLAVLKAGGCYVPLDPAYPPDRLARVLAHAELALVVGSAPALAALARPEGLGVLDLGAAAQAIAGQPATAPDSAVAPGDLAYLLYTSGSTGVPKGVAMPHRPLANLVAWQIAREAPARTLQFASLNFDVSAQEILSTLANGGTLVLPTEDERRDMERLGARIRSAEIARLFLPFAALQSLAATAADWHEPGALREIVTAGEQLQITPAVAELVRRAGVARLRNQYGPTETHVVTEEVLAGDPAGWPALPPIGRPIANCRAYVLDERGEPQPIGVPGELHLGGACVAQGYLGAPELTAERFLPDPFAGAAGGRMYRTGDIARWLPDGRLTFLGRRDGQVKIRGFRVELGEIEAVLAACPGVAEAAATVWTGETGAARLAAYVVAAAPGLSLEAVRNHARRMLPEHMMPADLIAVERLPTTASGKIDRRALPRGEGAGSEREGVFLAPRTPVEDLLAGIWGEVLGIARVGVTDDFFHLGGHSLMATRVMSRIKSTLNISLPLRLLFERPTIAGLADAVVSALLDEEEASATLLDEIEALPDGDVTAGGTP